MQFESKYNRFDLDRLRSYGFSVKEDVGVLPDGRKYPRVLISKDSIQTFISDDEALMGFTDAITKLIIYKYVKDGLFNDPFKKEA